MITSPDHVLCACTSVYYSQGIQYLPLPCTVSISYSLHLSQNSSDGFVCTPTLCPHGSYALLPTQVLCKTISSYKSKLLAEETGMIRVCNTKCFIVHFFAKDYWEFLHTRTPHWQMIVTVMRSNNQFLEALLTCPSWIILYSS